MLSCYENSYFLIIETLFSDAISFGLSDEKQNQFDEESNESFSNEGENKDINFCKDLNFNCTESAGELSVLIIFYLFFPTYLRITLKYLTFYRSKTGKNIEKKSSSSKPLCKNKKSFRKILDRMFNQFSID